MDQLRSPEKHFEHFKRVQLLNFFILVLVDAVYAMAHALHNLVLHQVQKTRKLFYFWG